MIQAFIIKNIIKIVMKQLLKQFKFDKIQKYVEEPNELDKKVEKLEKTVKRLQKLSHPVADFVCTKCDTKAKRIKRQINN